MLFSIEDIPYRGYFTYLKKRAYIWPLILFYFVARLFCQHIHLVMCTGGGHFCVLIKLGVGLDRSLIFLTKDDMVVICLMLVNSPLPLLRSYKQGVGLDKNLAFAHRG